MGAPQIPGPAIYKENPDSQLTKTSHITPPHPSRCWSKTPYTLPTNTPPTPQQPKHRHTSNTKAQIESSHPLRPLRHTNAELKSSRYT